MYDTEQFINEIELQPAIWDSNKEIYNNKVEKSKAWDTVCYKLFPDFSEKNTSEKNEIATQLKRRWKSLRDSYTREVGRMKRSKGDGRRQYIFFAQLNFLHNVVAVHNKNEYGASLDENTADDSNGEMHDSTASGAGNPEAILGDIWSTNASDLQHQHHHEQNNLDLTAVTPCSEDLWQNTPPADLWNVPPDVQQVPGCSGGYQGGNNFKRKKEDQSYSERNLYELLNQSVQLRLRREVNSENDGDRLFMLSLVPDLKALPEQEKLEAKCEIMAIFKKFKSCQQNHHRTHNLRSERRNHNHQNSTPNGNDSNPEQSGSTINFVQSPRLSVCSNASDSSSLI